MFKFIKFLSKKKANSCALSLNASMNMREGGHCCWQHLIDDDDDDEDEK